MVGIKKIIENQTKKNKPQDQGLKTI